MDIQSLRERLADEREMLEIVISFPFNYL